MREKTIVPKFVAIYKKSAMFWDMADMLENMFDYSFARINAE